MSWWRYAITALWIGTSGLGAGGCAHWMFRAPEHASEVIYARTEDGWNIALHHYPKAAGSPARQAPVVVCHGITSNRFNWDLTDRLSLPLYLASLGFDTWSIELRGGGLSRKPGGVSDEGPRISLDDYILRDVPAVIQEIQKKTGSPQVHWVAHSMGGTVLYGYLQRVRQDTIRSATMVAAPSSALDHNHKLQRTWAIARWVGDLIDELPTGTASKMGALLASVPLSDEMRLVWNYDNLGPGVARLAAANSVDNLSALVVQQMGGDSGTGHIRSVDGRYDYTQGMERIEVPMLFLAGALDQLAPPAVLLDGYERVSSPDKKLEVLGVANGYSQDYGHVDLCIGKSAPDEVYPLIGNWLLEHDPEPKHDHGLAPTP